MANGEKGKGRPQNQKSICFLFYIYYIIKFEIFQISEVPYLHTFGFVIEL